MERDERPDPDRLLNAIKAEEEALKRGRLRIFLGMSAGVGKTYAMLKAAEARRVEGIDVVIGVVETHGRVETEELTHQFRTIPRKKLPYKGIVLEEMDLDAVLELRPPLVLVDELAHTNAPGSRHNKRYQDVIEILDAGIDVYSTLNIQHLESRKDLVEQITGVTIRETVPDSVLDLADQVELVDITPSDLLKRLKEGKVYLGDKAERAAQNFFMVDKLTALREIALRFTAERVDHDLQKYHERRAGGAPWSTNERLMVAVSHSPYSERLIRTTRRIAYNLESPWIAVHIDTGTQLNDEDLVQLRNNIALASELGADVITTADTDVAEALRRVARQKNVTQIVVGRPTRRWIKDILEGGSLLDRLVRESWEVDVHVLRQEDEPKRRTSLLPRFNLQSGFIAYWNTFWFILGLSLLSGLFESMIGYRSVGFIFMLGVVVVGLLGSMGPVLLAAALSALSWNFFFIPPRFTFTIHRAEDTLLCLTFFIVADVLGALTNRIRTHQVLLREREENASVLYGILQDIASTGDKDEYLSKVVRRLGSLLDGECGVLLRGADEELDARSEVYNFPLSEKEIAVAEWVFENGKPAGWSTQTLSQARNLYVPLQGNQETVGTMIYRPRSGRELNLEQETLLMSVCRQLGLSLERHFLEESVREAEKLQESEKLHQTLLNSISHEMRTPLTAILGSASALGDEHSPDTPEFRKALAEELTQAGDRLNRVIENLLDMSRLGSGVLALKKEWHDVTDLVGVSLQRAGKTLKHHRLTVELQEDLPLVEMDFRLMEHVMANLLNNAATYAPKDSEIRVSVQTARRQGRRKESSEERFLSLVVEDSGPGIPEASLPFVFDKFYRVPGSPTGGTGLGLSIAKSIVELHNGEIRVENRPEGGARFVIMLPISKAPRGPE